MWDMAKTRHDVVCSFPLIEEIKETLVNKFGFTDEDAARQEQFLIWRTMIAIFTDVLPSVCRDPDDNVVLAAASEGKCEYLVTGDKDLLVLREFQGVQIIRPRDFMDMMERGDA